MFLPNDALKTVVYRLDSVMVPAVNKFFFFSTKTKTVNLKQSVTLKSKSTAT